MVNLQTVELAGDEFACFLLPPLFEMPIVVLCSTGLPAAERRAIEQAISLLDDVMYHGDLTDRTTHLVAKDSATSTEKIKCARKLHLPIVSPKWVMDSAAAGNRALLKLDSKYLTNLPPLDENNSPQLPQPHVATPVENDRVSGIVREPLALLRMAAELGELTLEPTPLPTSTTHVTLGGREYLLDAPTGFMRQQGAPATNGAAVDGGGKGYKLRELLFCVKCSRLSHADYFLQCALAPCEPVLLLDKRLLLASVLPRMGPSSGDSDGTSSGEAVDDTPEARNSTSKVASRRSSGGDAGRLLESPLTRSTLELISPMRLPDHASAEAAAAPSASPSVWCLMPPTPMQPAAGGERSRKIGALCEAADERARLNARVASLRPSPLRA